MGPRLKAAGLGRLTVSLDTLDETIFHRMSGEKGSVKEVLEGIRAAEEAGFDSIKINAVIQRGVNDHTILDLVKYFRGTSAQRAFYRIHGCGQSKPLGQCPGRAFQRDHFFDRC